MVPLFWWRARGKPRLPLQQTRHAFRLQGGIEVGRDGTLRFESRVLLVHTPKQSFEIIVMMETCFACFGRMCFCCFSWKPDTDIKSPAPCTKTHASVLFAREDDDLRQAAAFYREIGTAVRCLGDGYGWRVHVGDCMVYPSVGVQRASAAAHGCFAGGRNPYRRIRSFRR